VGNALAQLGAFIRRDFAITVSYRFLWALEILNVLLIVTAMFYVGRLVDAGAARALASYPNYFSYVLVGLTVFSYFFTALGRFAGSVREAQMNGTLEALLATPTPPLRVFVLTFTAIRVAELVQWVLYFAAGAVAFRFSLAQSNWVSVAVLFLLGVAMFVGLGLVSASFILAFKKGDPLNWALGSLTWLVSGTLFPPELLPPWLEGLARLFPVTPLILGLRKSLLLGAGLDELRGEALALAAFAAATLTGGLLLLHWAMQRARAEGSLGHY